VQGVAYMESIVAPREWSDFSESMRPAFEALRSPAGDAMVLQENFMVEKILFGNIRRPISDVARAESVQVVSRAGSSAGSYPQALK
jgi:haloalkane dehalogenase